MKKWTIDDIWNEIISCNGLNLMRDLYGDVDKDQAYLVRIQKLLNRFNKPAEYLFSAPGRTELGGNHTDHNLGKVLCAAVQKDTLAAVFKRDDDKVIVHSEGFPENFVVDINDLEMKISEKGSSTALVRGILAGIEEHGGTLGGFEAEVTSSVNIGSGLSSSACFEILIGTIINELFNDNDISPITIAKIGQFAENKYFGKPCGLMDQIASAIGGILKIDFADPDDPIIEKVPFNPETTDYHLVMLNTGSSHADLTSAYASIPAEMKEVARKLGGKALRCRSEDDLWNKMNSIRHESGDQAVLRALHFFQENKRVDRMVEALNRGDFENFLSIVNASGLSSQNLLRNVIPPGSNGINLGLGFALGVSQIFFEERKRGVARVHGGGFAGTIQAYVHKDDFDEYALLMRNLFGAEALEILNIRKQGSSTILKFSGV